jgi:queuine tRNA-ribosyltransferase
MEAIEAHDGLHRFMYRDKPILTEPGGFQVFRLGEMRKVTEAGLKFRSPVDASEVYFDSETSMKIQTSLHADIAMVFDESTPYPGSHKEAKESMQMSLHWAKRGADAFNQYENPNVLLGIVLGGEHNNSRDISRDGLIDIGSDDSATSKRSHRYSSWPANTGCDS